VTLLDLEQFETHGFNAVKINVTLDRQLSRGQEHMGFKATHSSYF
jgi:hypothetical protein